MNLYRVDRADSPVTPCGMNSILYMGDSFPQALRAFNAYKPGFNSWDQPSPDHGVLLSAWNQTTNLYEVKKQKWPDSLIFLFDLAAHDLFGPFDAMTEARSFAAARSIGAYSIVSQSERHSGDLRTRRALEPRT